MSTEQKYTQPREKSSAIEAGYQVELCPVAVEEVFTALKEEEEEAPVFMDIPVKTFDEPLYTESPFDSVPGRQWAAIPKLEESGSPIAPAPPPSPSSPPSPSPPPSSPSPPPPPPAAAKRYPGPRTCTLQRRETPQAKEKTVQANPSQKRKLPEAPPPPSISGCKLNPDFKSDDDARFKSDDDARDLEVKPDKYLHMLKAWVVTDPDLGQSFLDVVAPEFDTFDSLVRLIAETKVSLRQMEESRVEEEKAQVFVVESRYKRARLDDPVAGGAEEHIDAGDENVDHVDLTVEEERAVVMYKRVSCVHERIRTKRYSCSKHDRVVELINCTKCGTITDVRFCVTDCHKSVKIII